jgi:hypothetical protein
VSIAPSNTSGAGFWRYWSRVLARAYRDARSFLGHSWKKAIIGALGVFVTAAYLWRIEGVQQAVGKLEWLVLDCLADFAVVLLTLPIFLLRAPWLLEKETMKDLQAQLNQQNERITTLESAHAARLKEDSDSDKNALAYVRLERIKQECSVTMEKRNHSYPRSGGRYQLDGQQQQHVQETKNMLAEWLNQARTEASAASLHNYLPPASELDAVPSNLTDVELFSQRFLKAVDTVLKKLG